MALFTAGALVGGFVGVCVMCLLMINRGERYE